MVDVGCAFPVLCEDLQFYPANGGTDKRVCSQDIFIFEKYLDTFRFQFGPDDLYIGHVFEYPYGY